SVIAHFTVTGLATNNFDWSCRACDATDCYYASTNRTLYVDITNPDISFHSSSEANNTRKASYNNFAYINTTISDVSNNYSAFIDWNRSLVGWWRFEENYNDSSTWDNQGTCSGTQCPNLTTGMRGKAYKFDGVDDYVEVPYDDTLNITSEITISAWIYRSSDKSSAKIVEKVNAYSLIMSGTGTYFQLTIYNTSGSAMNTWTAIPYNVNQWYHVVGIYNRSNICIYVDGLLSKCEYKPNGIQSSTANVYLGGTSSYFNGSIDEVMVWDRALSPEEINASYNAGIWKLYHNFTDLDLGGTYTYKAYVVDQAGNLNNTEQRTIIINNAPTQETPILSSTFGTNLTSENLTVYPQSLADLNSDSLKIIYDWRVNGSSINVLNLPFEANTSTSTSTKDYSTYNNDGAVKGPVFSRNSGYDGFGAYFFDGGDNNITVANSASLNIDDNIAIEAWVKLSQKNVTSVASGYNHACAVVDDGTAMCWGYNSYGQLGDGTKVERPFPAPVKGLINATAISAGERTSCALLINKTVMCWGEGENGGLGTGSTSESLVPAKTLISNVSKISSGRIHTCAILENNTLMCWGYNYYGQVGSGDQATKIVPIKVANLTSEVINVSTGYAHTCAIYQNGTAMCWGYNVYGQLGDNTNTNSVVPKKVVGLINATVTTAGYYHTCALLENGTGMCWGIGTSGQLGSGSSTTSYIPVKVSGLINATELASALYTTCALLENKTIRCWGYNNLGQFGDNTTTGRNTPTNVLTLSNITSIASGLYSSYARNENNTLYAWGDNALGQTGFGAIAGRLTPYSVHGFNSIIGIPPGAAASTAHHNCVIFDNNTLNCWGYNVNGIAGKGSSTQIELSPIKVSLENVTNVSLSSAHTCALLQNGTIMCWGAGSYGRLGQGTTSTSYTPVKTKIMEAESIASGEIHNCAHLSNGTVMCWGYNIFGQIGNGSASSVGTPNGPERAVGITNAMGIATGQYHSCAVLDNGTVMCWGYNNNGQMGNGTTSSTVYALVPQKVPSIINATQVSSGYSHVCALLNNGTIMCWGIGTSGQLGNGASSTSNVPVKVQKITDAIKISSGSNHNCAILQNGTVMCWGYNYYGQFGDGTRTSRNSPIVVPGVTNATKIFAGIDYTCAVLENKTGLCWGRNAFGALGSKVPTTQLTPLPVVAEVISKSRTTYGIYTDYSYNPMIIGNINDRTLTSSIPRDSWSHIALSKNSSAISLYINGVQKESITYSETINFENTNVMIGRMSSGYIDDVRIWNRGLSSNQISLIYNNQSNVTHSDTTEMGDVWQACITPTDSYETGPTKCTNNLTIITSGKSVNLTSPEDNWYVNNTVKFECTASSSQQLQTIELYHNNTGAWHSNDTKTVSGYSAIVHFTVTGLAVNNFEWTCRVCDTDSCAFAPVNRTLYVDITNPDIEFVNPTSANNTKVATFNNYNYVNVSVSDASNNYSAFIDWNRSLVGYWRFEENYNDSSTWDNQGTCSGTQCPNLTTGIRGKAYKFDGIDDIINISNSESLNISDEITIEAWVKMQGWNNYPAIIAKGYSTPGEYSIHVRNDYSIFFELDENNGSRHNYNPTNIKLTLDSWNHVAATYNGSIQRIFIDGQEVGVGKAGSFNIREGSNPVWIGKLPGYGYFNGSIDEVQIYNRALSPEEVNASYNAKIHCYDNKTEILTEKGWKYFKDVTLNDKVATLNATNGKTEFNKPDEIQDYAYKGEMYNVETEKGNLLVSPEHKVYTKNASKSSIISLFENITTTDCRLNLGSLDQIGQFNFNASANIGTSLSCINCMALDSNSLNDSSGIVSINSSSLDNCSLNCPELSPEYFKTACLIPCFLSSSIAYAGENRHKLNDLDKEIISLTGLGLKNDTNMLVSTTNFISYHPSFLCLFHIPSLILSPIRKASASNSVSAFSLLSISSFHDNCLTFDIIDTLTNPDQFISGNCSIFCFTSAGTDNVMLTMLNTSNNVKKHKNVKVFKPFCSENDSIRQPLKTENLHLIGFVVVSESIKDKYVAFNLEHKNKTADMNSLITLKVSPKILKMINEDDITVYDSSNFLPNINSKHIVFMGEFVKLFSQRSNNYELKSHFKPINLSNSSKVIGFSLPDLSFLDASSQDLITSLTTDSLTSLVSSLSISDISRTFFIICNSSKLFNVSENACLATDDQLMMSTLSILFFNSLGTDNVIVPIFITSNNYLYPLYAQDIYKCFDYKGFENTIRQLPKIEESFIENLSDYNLVNIQEAHEMLEKGQKISFLDENLNKIEVKGISKESYDGRIYDVTAPNHILLVRRGGLVTWSGNSLYHNFTSLNPGTYTYKAYVVDQAGNLNNTEERTFIVNSEPTVTSAILNSTYGTNLTTENLTVYAQYNDNDSDTVSLVYDWRKDG
ncbi:MAG: hypothetical protein KKA65_06240, partial [Nanoarchaeota archaeon]|nr:hypothetical protein [Nanoarchaeota archaeon]